MTVITLAELDLEMERVWGEYTRSFGRARHKASYWANPKKERCRKDKYRKENPERIIFQRAKFYQLHKEEVKAKVAAYKARKRELSVR